MPVAYWYYNVRHDIPGSTGVDTALLFQEVGRRFDGAEDYIMIIDRC